MALFPCGSGGGGTLETVPISDIFSNTTGLNTSECWAKKSGKILYLYIESIDYTTTGWKPSQATFKSPYIPSGKMTFPSIDYSGGAGTASVNIQKLSGSSYYDSLTFYVGQIYGGHNILTCFMTIILE